MVGAAVVGLADVGARVVGGFVGQTISVDKKPSAPGCEVGSQQDSSCETMKQKEEKM